LRGAADQAVVMDKGWADYTGRIPEDLYRDALDLARVFDLSLSEWLETAVNEYVGAQLARRIVASAVAQVREARSRSGVVRGSERRTRRGGEMKPERVQYCLRMTRAAYQDAIDVALVFDMSLNQLFLGAIRAFVEYQLCQEATRNALAKIREVRLTGLSDPDAEPVQPRPSRANPG
jgi:hypothetical protein